jgi:hypothetical protein
MVSLISKIVFMSKFWGSCRNEWQRVRRYKEGHKILHEILINSAFEQDFSGYRTSHLLINLLRLPHQIFGPSAIPAIRKPDWRFRIEFLGQELKVRKRTALNQSSSG